MTPWPLQCHPLERDHGREDAIQEKYKFTTSTGGSIRSVFPLQDQWIWWGVHRGRRFLCDFRVLDDRNYIQRFASTDLLAS